MTHDHEKLRQLADDLREYKEAHEFLETQNTKLKADLAEAREALKLSESAMREYYRYWTGGETRGSYDGKPERNALWEAMRRAASVHSRLSGEG
jgi:hypothetical protein